MRRSVPTSVPRWCAAIGALLVATSLAGRAQTIPSWLDSYREAAGRLIGAALANDFAWQRLAELTDTFGPRLSGTRNLEDAIAWIAGEMRADGLEDVRTEPVMVPHWVRGEETLEIVSPGPRSLALLGLGGSLGTPPGGITAEPLVVSSFDDLDARAAEVSGRIVVYNVPYQGYGTTVQYRTGGASRAARHGAVAALVRSIGPMGLRTPHTGGMRYDADQPEIPAAAISAEDAAMLQRMQDRGTRVTLRLSMEAHFEPDAPSSNLMAEIPGRDVPEEIVVIGCHIDSWDPAMGASDDAGGCIVTWEALRLMKQLGLQPRRTVRVVLWTNEENGLRGATAYRDAHADELDRTVMMLESDSGVFEPAGFGFTGSAEARRIVTDIATLLDVIGANRIGPQGGGADIGPSVEAANIPALSLEVGGDYFLIHHSPADTVDRIDPSDVARNAAAIAVMTYVIADMPERLPKTE